jgi:hypothetical protein
MYYVAFVMFLNRRHALRFDKFDEMVRKFFHYRLKEAELGALALDLQTTGAFGSIGNHIHFAVPAFSDYLIARRFLLGDFAVGEERRAPPRPDADHRSDHHVDWDGRDRTKGDFVSRNAAFKEWLLINGELSRGMLLDAQLALYQRRKGETPTRHFLDEADEATGVRLA